MTHTTANALSAALKTAYMPQGSIPRPTPIAHTAKLQITSFQSGHGWVIGSGNPGSVVDDATTFALGSQSVKVTTAGAGAATRVEKGSLATFDATKVSVAVLLRVNDVTKLSAIKARLGTSAGAAYNVNIFGTANMTATIRSGEWHWFTFDCGNATNSGTPPATNTITFLGFDCFDNSTGPVQVNFQRVALIPKPATTFPNGVVSISFDDGYADQITTAKPILDKYGFPATAYVINDLLAPSGAAGTYGTVQQYLDAQNYSGWEIAGHAARAADHNLPGAFMDLTPTAMEQECQDMIAWFLANGFAVPTNMAWPQGKYTPANIAVVRKYFALARTIDFQPNMHESMPPARPMEVRCRPMDVTTSAAVITGLVDQAYANAGWLHLYTHRVNASPTGTQITPATFQTVVDYLATKGIPVLTVGQVLQALDAGRP